MSSEQICYLLLETNQNQDLFKTPKKAELIQSQNPTEQTKELTAKLYQILFTLEQQKNQFIAVQQKQTQEILDKTNAQKDQIIQDLLKSIYSLKKQNDQLKFQYRKRFKVIKNMQEKYQNLIVSKNIKIIELQSVVKYLQGKLKYLQKKITKYQSYMKKQISNKNSLAVSKSQQNYQNYLSPNKISIIISKEKPSFDISRNFLTRNSLQDLTIPLSSSHASLSKATSSSKTIARNKSRQNYKESTYFKNSLCESDLYSSFIGLNENDKYLETLTNFECNSRIKPICLQKQPSIAKDYINFEDFNDLQKNEARFLQRPARKSYQNTQRQSSQRLNIFRDKI